MAAKVFVGNLDFRTTKEEVETLFSQVGPIRDVFLPMDRETGRPRGFAFVEFESDDAAAKAIEKFNQYEMSGRALRVNAAEDRPRREGGGGGRPRFSGGGAPPMEDFGGGGGWGGDFGGGGGGYGRGGGAGDRFGGGGKSKGSRRNIRAKKRGL